MGKLPVEEKKKKKKGRPSLLDLQKRSLRLQKQQEQHQPPPKRNPNSTPNPYLRFPNTAPIRRSTRRNSSPDAAATGTEEDDDDEDDESSGKRREKKLKLVLRLPNRSTNSPQNASDSGSSGSGSHGDGEATVRKRKIDAVGADGREKTERHNSASKATDPLQGDPSDSGPTTPLPDKKLLVFILERLQKKDTYGVFSDPVDPNELPDYLEVIKHPMDFGTLRKKLSAGAYSSLEEFEKDIFLISSNAMRYNAPDTIYYRQARSIQELARKDFENLRQESDDNEPEPKTVRRGRPPSKKIIKHTVGRPPAERARSDFSSDATLANAGDGTHWSNFTHDLSRKGSALDKPGMFNATRASHGLRNSFSWTGEHKSERNEEYSGSALRGIQMKYGKKISVIDENRRNTYKQPQSSTWVHEPPVLTTFDGEKKQLVPVGVHMEHAYARSLARFAANLGPVGWQFAAKQIERVLPPGTKFGRGWVVDGEAPHPSHTPLLSASPPHASSLSKVSPSTTVSRGDDKLSERQEPSSHDAAVDEGHFSRTLPPPGSASAASNKSPNSMEGAECVARGSNSESGYNLLSAGSNIRPKAPFQLHQNASVQPTVNGINTGFGFNPSSQVGMVRPMRPPGNFVSEAPMMHARALNMISRSNNNFVLHTPMSHIDAERVKLVDNSGTVNSGRQGSGSPLPDRGHDSQVPWRALSLHPKPDSVPPDLNVRFQSPGSPATASGVMVDSQQPDLALQL